jgi:hypothetical protein
MFGAMPASGFYVRHLQGLSMTNIHIKTLADDARPAIVLHEVKDVEFFRIKAKPAGGAPVIRLEQVENFAIRYSEPIADTTLPQAASVSLPKS